MRLNKYLARGLGISRRSADDFIKNGRVRVNSTVAPIYTDITPDDVVEVDRRPVRLLPYCYLLLHKPVGYVCSHSRQGITPTIYELLPKEYRHLKSAGRLDRDSSGLILLTDDGDLAYRMTHPKFAKSKTYLVSTERILSNQDMDAINAGINLEDGQSRMLIGRASGRANYQITMSEGRNRQIRRTLQKIGHRVRSLQRIAFGQFQLAGLATGKWRILNTDELETIDTAPEGSATKERQ